MVRSEAMALRENPVLWKEMKIRTRSRQPGPVRMAILFVVGGLVLFCYYHALTYIVSDGRTEAARDGYHVAVGIQAILIWLLCPALAANAVTQEKEQQTWDMLIFTLLTPLEILTGKLLARLLPILGILAAFFPFMAIMMVLHGATPGEFLLTYFLFGIWIFFLTTVSLFMSWAFKKTASAIAMSYLVLFILSIGTALLEMTLSASNPGSETPIIWLNPVRILNAMLSTSDDKGGQVLTFSTMVFAGVMALLFWRMVSRFREFAVE